jgi:hypothetical protein
MPVFVLRRGDSGKPLSNREWLGAESGLGQFRAGDFCSIANLVNAAGITRDTSLRKMNYPKG